MYVFFYESSWSRDRTDHRKDTTPNSLRVPIDDEAHACHDVEEMRSAGSASRRVAPQLRFIVPGVGENAQDGRKCYLKFGAGVVERTRGGRSPLACILGGGS